MVRAAMLFNASHSLTHAVAILPSFAGNEHATVELDYVLNAARFFKF